MGGFRKKKIKCCRFGVCNLEVVIIKFRIGVYNDSLKEYVLGVIM